MKAAVLHHFGDVPRYEDFPDPTPGENETLVAVKAVPLENVDKFIAAGKHYAARQFLPSLPAIVGFDGIGMREDGTLIGFGGIKPPYGALAEKVAIQYAIPIPDGVDAVTAASIPSSALTALFALKWAAKMQAGETVLINGATGFAGKLAVQIARMLGAGRIVGSGRDTAALQAIRDLGADAVIDLKQSDDQIRDAFKSAAGENGYQVILDFLWGHPTELLLKALVPDKLAFARGSIRLVQAGEMAGPNISLPADTLRTSGLRIMGGGDGLTPEAIGEGSQQVWDWIKAGKLHAEVEAVPLKDIESAWTRDLHGKRLVVTP